MPGIDAAIPLGIQMPKLLTPFEAQSNALSLQAQMQQAQVRQQELVQGQQAMRDQMELSTLAAVPGNIDPKTGTFTAEALTQIKNPLLRQNLNQDRIGTLLKSAEVDFKTSEAGQAADKRKTEALHGLFENAYSVYESTLAATGSKQVATEAFNKAQSDGFKELKDTGRGGFSADTNFRILTPEDVAAKLITHKERVEEEEKRRSADRGEETPFIKESRYLDKLKGQLADLKPNDPASGPLRQQIAQLQAHIAKLDAPSSTQINMTPPVSQVQAGLHGDEYLKTLPAAERNRVSMLLEGSLKPTEISMRNGEREKALAQARQADPNFDPGASTVNRAIELEFAKGKPALSLQSINAVTEHLDTYRGLARALDNGDAQLYNKFKALLQRQTGATLPNDIKAAAPIIGAEIVKSIVPAGGGVAEREEAQKQWSDALSKKQVESQIDNVFVPLMRGQASSLKQRYEASGKKDFNTRFLTPQSRKALGLDDAKSDHPADISNLLDKYGKK